MGVARWAAASPDSAEICSARTRVRWSITPLTPSINAVSTTSWLVSPRWIHGATAGAARRRSSATRPMAGLPPSSAPSASRSASSSVSRLGRSASAHSGGAGPTAARASSQADSTADHGPQHRPVRHQCAGPVVPRASSRLVIAHRPGQPGTPSRSAPAGGCRNGMPRRRFRRRTAGCAAGRRSGRPAQGRHGASTVRQVGAGEQPVQQPPGEHGEGEERRRRGRRNRAPRW